MLFRSRTSQDLGLGNTACDGAQFQTPGWSATLTLPDYGRVARHSSAIGVEGANPLFCALLDAISE